MRRSGVGAVAAGAVLLIAAAVGFIVVPEHRPQTRTELLTGVPCPTSQQDCKLSSAQAAEGQTRPQCYPENQATATGPMNYGNRQCWYVAIASGPSKPLYDGLKIVTWALAIVGGLLVVTGLIRYARPEVQR